MPHVLNAPVEPGTRHRFELNCATMIGAASIDYTIGPLILLHISIRSRGQIIVLNEKIGTAWGEQIELRLPAHSSADLLRIEVFFDYPCVTVRAGEHPPVEVVGRLDVGEAEQIHFPDQISLTALKPAPSPPLPLRLSPRSSGARAVGGPLLGRIQAADIQHLAGWLQADPYDGGPRLKGLIVALANGPELERHAIELPASGRFERSEFVIPLRPHPGLKDGADVRLLAETAEPPGRIVLDQAPLATTIIGGIDRVTPRLVGGWAWNAGFKHAAVPVEILINGEVVGNALANRNRPDLGDIDPLLTRCGFLFRMPGQLATQAAADLSVTVRVARTAIMLANGPWPLARHITPSPVAELVE